MPRQSALADYWANSRRALRLPSHAPRAPQLASAGKANEDDILERNLSRINRFGHLLQHCPGQSFPRFRRSPHLGHVGIRIFPSLLALGTIPAGAAAEDDLGDGGSADRAGLLRIDLQLLAIQA